MAERQSALRSKIANDGLTRSVTGCFIAVTIICQQWASNGWVLVTTAFSLPRFLDDFHAAVL